MNNKKRPDIKELAKMAKKKRLDKISKLIKTQPDIFYDHLNRLINVRSRLLDAELYKARLDRDQHEIIKEVEDELESITDFLQHGINTEDGE